MRSTPSWPSWTVVLLVLFRVAGSVQGRTIEISADKYVARSADIKDGLPFVPIKRGEKYAVRLTNDAQHEAAVMLSIDGLNFFSFSDVKDAAGQPRYSVVLVAPGKSVLIKGWHRDNKNSDKFLVTEIAKSAAAELRSTANIGTITAQFMASWPKNGSPPTDEPKQAPPHSRSVDATGRGERIQAPFVEVERVFGVSRGSVSVRYTK